MGNFENVCSRACDDRPDTNTRVAQTPTKRSNYSRSQGGTKVSRKGTDSDSFSDSDIDTDHSSDGHNGEMSPSDIRVMAKFKTFVTSGAQDDAMRLVDKHHYVDLHRTDFGKGASCLHIASRSGMAKLLLFLLEEGHLVCLRILALFWFISLSADRYSKNTDLRPINPTPSTISRIKQLCFPQWGTRIIILLPCYWNMVLILTLWTLADTVQ